VVQDGAANRLKQVDLSVEKVRQTVFSVIDELNEQLPAAQRLVKDDSTALVGPDGSLDSLGVVNLVALLEQRIESDFNTSISLIDAPLVEDASVHLMNVASLTRYLTSVLAERVDR
jgi:hypothetical protein